MATIKDDTEQRVIFPAGDLAARIAARRLSFSLFSALPRLAYRPESTRPLRGIVAPLGKTSADGVKSDVRQSAFSRFIKQG